MRTPPPRTAVFALTVATAAVVIVTRQEFVPMVLLPLLLGLLVTSADRWMNRPAPPPATPQAPQQPAPELESIRQRRDARVRAAARRFPQASFDRRMLLTVTGCLLMVGAVMVWSASERPGEEHLASLQGTFLVRFASFSLAGLVLLGAAANGGVAFLRRALPVLLPASFALLVVVLIPGVGIESNGARSWLGSGWLLVAPGELVKLPLILFAAGFLAAHPRRVRRLATLTTPLFVVTGGVALLVLVQPDAGTALMICVVVVAMLVTAGVPLRQLAALTGAGVLLSAVLLLTQPHQLERLAGFVDPWSEASGSGFQLVQSQIALGSGGLLGHGLGDSIQKALYLPSAHDDFILAVIGEELGALGVVAVATLFVLLAWVGLRIARATTDAHDKLVAVGLTTLIVGQALANMYVVLGLAPPSGLALPFVSYSPTNLLVTLAAVGLLLDVHRRHPRTVALVSLAKPRAPRLMDRRLGLIFLTLLASFAIVELRSLFLATVHHGELQRRADAQQMRIVPLLARRGAIVDRRRFVLATSRQAFDVTATPYLVDNPERVAAALAGPLGLTVDEVARRLDTDSGFVYLARQASPAVAKDIRRLGFEGVDLVPTMTRAYPRLGIASQTIGAVGLDGNGLWGVEAGLDARLGGRDGYARQVYNALGEQIARTVISPMAAGDSVELTLDAGLQAKVESVLGQVGADAAPRGATAVILDVRTAEVLAMANWPPLDVTRLDDASRAAFHNRAIEMTYEPGRTIGVFTVAAALQEGRIAPDEILEVPRSLAIDDQVTIVSRPGTSGALTAAQIVERGSDTGALILGLRLGGPRFGDWMRRFGFGVRTGIGLPEERTGNVPRLDRHAVAAMSALPTGRSLSVTPLQLAAAYAALADGTLRPPRLVSRVAGRVRPRPQSVRVLATGTAATVRAMLAPSGAISSTTSLVDPPSGLPSWTRVVNSVAGLAPADDPLLAVVVVVDQPDSAGPSDLAGEAFRDITRFALPYLGIASDRSTRAGP